jgi:hypothetical protein
MFGVVANQFTIPTDLDQFPVVSAGNISVTLI